MKNAAKIRLSRVEEQLVKRSDWILTKNSVMLKIKTMLEGMQKDQQRFAEAHASAELLSYLQVPPKVSRGENYRGLPWLVLDYPRYFSSGDMLAIRTMFWWGQHFSVTLLAAGEPKRRLEPALEKAHGLFRKHGYACCINDTAWEHHFEADNYISFTDMPASVYRKQLEGSAFFKAGKQFPVGNFEALPAILNREYRRLMKIVADQLPRR